MTDRSLLDARLAEIDRRLRAIQSGLAPVADGPVALSAPEPPPPSVASPPVAPAPPPRPPARATAPPPAPPPASPPPPVRATTPSPAADNATALSAALADARRLAGELNELRAEHAQVIAAARSLLSGLAEQLARTDPAPAAGARPAPSATAAAALAAGPFHDAASLRHFAESIRDLPNVTGVEVREFVGGNRAVLDVHVVPARPRTPPPRIS